MQKQSAPTRFSPRDVALAAHRVGEWLSLVEHLVRDQGVGGSNPLSPTIVDKLVHKLTNISNDAGILQFKEEQFPAKA